MFFIEKWEQKEKKCDLKTKNNSVNIITIKKKGGKKWKKYYFS